jgi:hypothetical protein
MPVALRLPPALDTSFFSCFLPPTTVAAALRFRPLPFGLLPLAAAAMAAAAGARDFSAASMSTTVVGARKRCRVRDERRNPSAESSASGSLAGGAAEAAAAVAGGEGAELDMALSMSRPVFV